MRHLLLALSVPAALAALLAGCGGGSASSTTGLGGDVGVLTSDYLVLDLETGAIEARTALAAGDAALRDRTIAFRAIPAGSFVRGSAPTDFAAQLSEAQASAATGRYHLGVFEVTQAQWIRLARLSAPPYPWSDQASLAGAAAVADGERPAFDLSRSFIAATLATASARLGVTLRLPSDDEWERACRAGTATAFSWGDPGLTPAATAAAYARVAETAGGASGPARAGSLQPNGFGLYDMHGNVWEWTSAGAGTIRGGSWNDTLPQARSANLSDELDEDTPHPLVGLRLVLVP